MTNQIITAKGNPYPIGVTVLKDGSLNIAVAMNSKECGIIFSTKTKGEKIKVPFDSACRIGGLYCVNISGIQEKSNLEYCFYDGEERFIDAYAGWIAGNEQYGKPPKKLSGAIYENTFDWEEDRPLCIPYSDSLFYQLHVRGFTKHSSSGVEKKGTFEGIVEKISYLKELGITAVELMPCYEFLEMEDKVILDERIPIAYQNTDPVLNYWGYKKGYYFAPKSAYAAGNDPVYSFKYMVKELHKAGIEVIMQFYFPNEVSGSMITDVLRYWVCQYHIDGFHLKGERIPNDLLATDPLLRETKLLYYGYNVGEIYGNKAPAYKNLAICRDDYMYDMRKFLKSDERMLGNVLYHMKTNPKEQGIVHYFTETNGFTLHDMVSFDRKHNESNGENNLDGKPYNASWNCGAEGKTKKKPVLDLRLKQMRNAFLLSLFSQSTPMILAGDEFANSQKGNNNAYCQDNVISWLNWNDVNKNSGLFSFVKDVIAFRKEHALLHRSKEYTMLDELGCGYPDLSYHSEDAWKCHYDDLTRHFGMMYCGNYSEDKTEEGTFIYLAVNMHWVPHEFALPKLPDGVKWYLIYDTNSKEIRTEKVLKKQNEFIVTERSIQVLIAK